MGNNIDGVFVSTRSLDPAGAEVWVTVWPEFRNRNTDVRGRLMGPICHYSSTVEVAYPLRPFSRPGEEWQQLTRRVLIPDPCLWDPVSPFLYQGTVELWEENRRVDERQVSHGLRAFELGPRGLLLNGQLLSIKGLVRNQLSAEDALTLRHAGHNALLIAEDASMEEMWQAADKYGFLILCRLTRGKGESLLEGSGVDYLRRLCEQPSCLGWILSQNLWQDKTFRKIAVEHLKKRTGPFLGVEIEQPLVEEELKDCQFVVCPEKLLTGATALHRPLILLGEMDVAQTISSATILGTIQP